MRKYIFFVVFLTYSLLFSVSQEGTFAIRPLREQYLENHESIRLKIENEIKSGRFDLYNRRYSRIWHQLSALNREIIITQIINSIWLNEGTFDLLEAEYKNISSKLNPLVSKMHLEFQAMDELVGGVGNDSYGQNCWFTTISCVAGLGIQDERKKESIYESWNSRRFMGPAEFRTLMKKCSKVEIDALRFGDIIRYYIEDTYTIQDLNIFSGEIHAAVYIGKSEAINGETKKLFLTKNGRRGTDFMIIQDEATLDKNYLSEKDGDKLRQRFGKDLRKKEFFRYTGLEIYNPMKDRTINDVYVSYLVDQLNYKERWIKLSQKVAADMPTEGYQYPKEWMTINWQ